MLRVLASSAGFLLGAALVFGVGCAPASIECDVKSEACRDDAFQSVAEFLGEPDAKQPPVRVLSEDEFSEDLLNDPGLAGGENTNRWLQMLGLLDPGTTLVDYHHELIGFNGEGHYHPDTESITIVDRPGRSFGELVRRYIMAIAHQKYGLAANERGVPLDDASLAKRAVLEGYGFLQTDLWYTVQYGAARESYDVTVQGAALSAIRRDILINPGSYGLDAIWYFPYERGWLWMAYDCWIEDPSCADKLRDPPESSMLDGFRGDQPDFAHPAPPEGFDEVESRQLGWWWIEVFVLRSVMELYANVPPDLATDSGVNLNWHWIGDRLSVYRRGAEMVLVWRVRIRPSGGSDTRQRLLESVNDSENGHWFAEADDWDVMIVIAESETQLEAWRTQ